MWIIQFRVKGTGGIYDMLRYDACYPKQGEDASKLEAASNYKETVEVMLEHRSFDKNWKPNSERWASFGWKVIPESIINRGRY